MGGLKGKALTPDEIVKEILHGRTVSPARERVLNAQWRDLWKNVVEQVKAKSEEEGLEFDPTRLVPLSDVSGSMYGKPMEVAIAMGIGMGEITHSSFQNMVITFETNPRWHKLEPGDGIVQKVRSLERAPWGGSTDFEKAYDQILKVCLENDLTYEDVPSLIVFSDMQFNQANNCDCPRLRRRGRDVVVATMHDVVRSKFAAAAGRLGWTSADPTPIVYWNLRTAGGHPVQKETQGAVLLSGYSPSMLKMVMNGEALKDEEVEVVEADGTVRREKVRVTPWEVLRKVLDDPLYDPVREILAASDEGTLRGYRFENRRSDDDANATMAVEDDEGGESNVSSINKNDANAVVVDEKDGDVEFEIV